MEQNKETFLSILNTVLNIKECLYLGMEAKAKIHLEEIEKLCRDSLS